MTARILIRNKENNAVWAMDVAERFRKSVDARDVIEVALETVGTITYDGKKDDELRFTCETARDAEQVLDAYNLFISL